MLRSVAGGVTLAVRALPGAKKKTAIDGVYCEGEKSRLKIRVQAPAVEGRANAALIEFLAEMFGVPKSYVELVSGELSRSKVFLLRGLPWRRRELSWRTGPDGSSMNDLRRRLGLYFRRSNQGFVRGKTRLNHSSIFSFFASVAFERSVCGQHCFFTDRQTLRDRPPLPSKAISRQSTQPPGST